MFDPSFKHLIDGLAVHDVAGNAATNEGNEEDEERDLKNLAPRSIVVPHAEFFPLARREPILLLS